MRDQDDAYSDHDVTLVIHLTSGLYRVLLLSRLVWPGQHSAHSRLDEHPLAGLVGSFM